MDDLKNQVARAQRSLVLQQFVEIAPWCLCIALAIAAIAVAVPKFWVLEVDGTIWFWSWFGGAVAGGLLLAVVVTWLRRRGEMEAAIELDRRFGLKERVSSTLSLAPTDLDTEAGRALAEDASRRVARLDVGEKFPVAGSWWSLLPLVPAATVFLLMVLVDAQPDSAQAYQQEIAVRKNIKKQGDDLKKKIAEKAKKAEENGLPEAKDLFKKIEEGVDKAFQDTKVDAKSAMAGLSDLAKQIKERQQKLGGQDQVREQLNQMKDLKKGPADKIGEAMKQGDFQKAIDEIKTLQDDLKKGDLKPEDQKKLAEQLDQMQKKLQDAVDAHEQAKRDLEKEIADKLKAGDREGAAQAQQKLDKMKQNDGAMNKMQQLAQKMGKACENCKAGDQQAAADQLAQMAEDLKGLQDAEAELKELDDALDQIAQAKQQMACKQCQGAGCKECEGGGLGDGDNDKGKPGKGMGKGRGIGDRPEQETDKRFHDSQVAAKVGKGASVSAGQTGGPNAKGKVLEEIKDSFAAGERESEASLTDKPIPRAVREHAKEYLDKVRAGE